MRPTPPPRSPRSGPPLQPCSAGCPGPRTEQQVRTSSRCELEKRKKKEEEEDDEEEEEEDGSETGRGR